MNEPDQQWPGSVEHRIAYIAGQVLALNIAVTCLLKTHSDPEGAAHLMQQECEDAMSYLLPSMLDDAFLEGMGLVKDRFVQGIGGKKQP